MPVQRQIGFWLLALLLVALALYVLRDVLLPFVAGLALAYLLDPIADRLLVLSGVIVTWHFELLPQWALAVLAARELFMLFVTEAALRTGRDIEIKMVGRWAVWPTMFSIFLAMLSPTPIADALLLLGLALSVSATLLYVRDGVRANRA